MSENRETAGPATPIFPAMELDPDACYAALTTRDARFDGRFFTGVTSTGIYCRPVCPARTPKRENVVFHPSAAAAEAARQGGPYRLARIAVEADRAARRTRRRGRTQGVWHSPGR